MKKLVAIALALLLCLSAFSVAAAEYEPDGNARYIELGEIDGYTLLYDTETLLTDESYTRIIGDFYFTTHSDELGLSLSDGKSTIPLESAYGVLIGDSGIKSVAKAVNKCKQNGLEPFDKWIVINGSPTEREKFDTGSGKVYYLFGWIYGQNYACEENAGDMGNLRFENGQLTVNFDEDAYVAVKEENNAEWYMTDGWLGTDVTSATLYSTSVTGGNSNKLYVPAGVDIRFTLVENSDGSLTLSYSTEGEDDTTEPTTDGDFGGAVPPSSEEGNPPQAPSQAPTNAPTTDSSESTPVEPTEKNTDSTQPTVDSSAATESSEIESVTPTTSTTPNIEPTETEPTAPRTDPIETPTEMPTEKPTEKPTEDTVSPSAKIESNINIIAATLQAGKTITLKATNKNGKKISATFSSSNKKVAKVTGKGKVYALKRGVTKITMKYKKKKVGTCLINVVTSPKLSKNKIKLKKGQAKTVKISGKSSVVKNTYKNTKIAKVISARTAKKLKIRGLKKGTTKLTIKVNGVKLKLKVIVS